MTAQDSQGKPDLAGGRSWKELTERDEVGIAGLVDPFAALNEFVAEIAEMGDRAAKRCQTELEKSPKHLAERAAVVATARVRVGARSNLHPITCSSLFSPAAPAVAKAQGTRSIVRR